MGVKQRIRGKGWFGCGTLFRGRTIRRSFTTHGAMLIRKRTFRAIRQLFGSCPKLVRRRGLMRDDYTSISSGSCESSFILCQIEIVEASTGPTSRPIVQRPI